MNVRYWTATLAATTTLVAGCATTKTQTADTTSSAAQPAAVATSTQEPIKETPAAAMVDHEGDSTGTAVEVPADAPNDGIDFQNRWIYNKFGRFRRHGGGTGSLNGRRYDIIEIELPSGDTKKVYFDITENWKNWVPPAKK